MTSRAANCPCQGSDGLGLESIAKKMSRRSSLTIPSSDGGPVIEAPTTVSEAVVDAPSQESVAATAVVNSRSMPRPTFQQSMPGNINAAGSGGGSTVQTLSRLSFLSQQGQQMGIPMVASAYFAPPRAAPSLMPASTATMSQQLYGGGGLGSSSWSAQSGFETSIALQQQQQQQFLQWQQQQRLLQQQQQQQRVHAPTSAVTAPSSSTSSVPSRGSSPSSASSAASKTSGSMRPRPTHLAKNAQQHQDLRRQQFLDASASATSFLRSQHQARTAATAGYSGSAATAS